MITWKQFYQKLEIITEKNDIVQFLLYESGIVTKRMELELTRISSRLEQLSELENFPLRDMYKQTATKNLETYDGLLNKYLMLFAKKFHDDEWSLVKKTTNTQKD